MSEQLQRMTTGSRQELKDERQTDTATEEKTPSQTETLMEEVLRRETPIAMGSPEPSSDASACYAAFILVN